jgi:hypothetical protein
MFAPDLRQQFNCQSGQYYAGCEVLDQAAHLMAGAPDRGKQAAAKADQGGNRHG